MSTETILIVFVAVVLTGTVVYFVQQARVKAAEEAARRARDPLGQIIGAAGTIAGLLKF